MFSAVRLLPLVNSTETTGHPWRYGTSKLWIMAVHCAHAARRFVRSRIKLEGDGPTE
jgi:hypothetical protein